MEQGRGEKGVGEGWHRVINIQNEEQESRAVPSDKYLAPVPTPERLNSVINANLPAVPPTPYHPLRLLSRLCTYPSQRVALNSLSSRLTDEEGSMIPLGDEEKLLAP